MIKRGHPLSYLYRSDYHWSLEGCMSASQAIPERVGPYPNTPLLSENTFQSKTVVTPLTRLL